MARCAGIKAAVVAEDEREGGRRMILNYGHTLGPRARGRRRGPSIPTGTCATARPWPSGSSSPPCWPSGSGASTPTRVDEHRRVVGSFDLPTDLPPGAEAAELVAFMGRDKKAQQDLTFVLDGPDGVEVVRGVAVADVVATLAAMGART